MALTAGSGGTTIVKTTNGRNEMYTVPSGKTFRGQIWNTSSTGPGYIDGVQLRWPYSSSYFAQRAIDVTLSAGTKVEGDPSGWTMLLGVEE